MINCLVIYKIKELCIDDRVVGWDNLLAVLIGRKIADMSAELVEINPVRGIIIDMESDIKSTKEDCLIIHLYLYMPEFTLIPNVERVVSSHAGTLLSKGEGTIDCIQSLGSRKKNPLVTLHLKEDNSQKATNKFTESLKLAARI